MSNDSIKMSKADILKLTYLFQIMQFFCHNMCFQTKGNF